MEKRLTTPLREKEEEKKKKPLRQIEEEKKMQALRQKYQTKHAKMSTTSTISTSPTTPTFSGQQKLHEIKKKAVRLVVIGETGNGKSTLCNKLICKNLFKEYATLTKSGTQKAVCIEGRNFMGELIRVIDTQGYSDTDGKDFTNSKQMIELIKNEGTVNAFLLVFNGSLARWNSATLGVLDLLGQNFPRFWDNVIVILNFMPQDKKAIKRRESARSDAETVA